MVDVLSAFPATASTANEYNEREANRSTPPDATYDNRLSLEERVVRALRVVREPWQLEAACADQNEIMFEHIGESKGEIQDRERLAKKICESCKVIDQCLDHAVTRKERGAVWGGLNDLERKRYIKRSQAS